MNMLDLLMPPAAPEETGRIYGVVIGVVAALDDPDEAGRVRLTYPWLADDIESAWARVATLMAGAGRGALFRPEVGDEVLVLFEHGDMRFPFVVGALWNGQDTPPEERSADADNDKRLIKSRSGHLVVLDDTGDAEKIEIIGKGGGESVVIDCAEGTITLTASADIVLSAPDGKIVLETGELELSGSSAAAITSDGDIEMAASGTLTLNGATVNIN